MPTTFGLINPNSLIKLLERQQKRAARIRPITIVFLDFLCTVAGEEEINTFLTGPIGEDHKRRFLTVAYQLSRVPTCSREEKFQEIMADAADAIDEEVRHDGGAVMNMVFAADAIKKGKELIFLLAEGIDRRIQSAGDQMISVGFCKPRRINADAIFRNLIPHNPDAL